ncbi:MAG: ATP-binding cassette domain-containing protein [Betaproteobacteria bacterium]|nr:ATP-binding cassette domain-containing protein [Betaproteobacteria bacterium]
MDLDSIIAKGSSGFSSGQSQRVLLARAFVVKPAVLLLGEATSNLEVASEKTSPKHQTTWHYNNRLFPPSRSMGGSGLHYPFPIANNCTTPPIDRAVRQ